MITLTTPPRSGPYFWPQRPFYDRMPQSPLFDRSHVELVSRYPYALQGLSDSQQVALLTVNNANQITAAQQIPWIYLAGGLVVLIMLMK
jgi:hypothetical protein